MNDILLCPGDWVLREKFHDEGPGRISEWPANLTQQAQEINPMLNQNWPIVYDSGPILIQHQVIVLCLLWRFLQALQVERWANIWDAGPTIYQHQRDVWRTSWQLCSVNNDITRQTVLINRCNALFSRTICMVCSSFCVHYVHMAYPWKAVTIYNHVGSLVVCSSTLYCEMRKKCISGCKWVVKNKTSWIMRVVAMV